MVDEHQKRSDDQAIEATRTRTCTGATVDAQQKHKVIQSSEQAAAAAAADNEASTLRTRGRPEESGTTVLPAALQPPPPPAAAATAAHASQEGTKSPDWSSDEGESSSFVEEEEEEWERVPPGDDRKPAAVAAATTRRRPKHPERRDSRRRLLPTDKVTAAAATDAPHRPQITLMGEVKGLRALSDAPTLFGQRPPASMSGEASQTTTTTSPPRHHMTSQDIEICQRLDEEYEQALEEREIGYHARYDSVRQTAGFSIAFMFLYMTLGTLFFTQAAGWEVREALFFSIYTVTTVGYGSGRSIPKTPGFQIYTIFYILIGIATLTIMVAQVYQCIALETSRAQHSRDKAELARRSDGLVKESSQHSSGNDPEGQDGGPSQMRRSNASTRIMMDLLGLSSTADTTWVVEGGMRTYHSCRRFFRRSQYGRGMSVVFPLAGLVLLGALVVGPIEGWTIVESLYFAVVSLTTIGYGDTVPEKPASIWFSIFWLPFSVGFMSLYLGNVARFYIRLSDKNIQRLERQMRRRIQRAKEDAEKERMEVLRRALRGQGSAAAVSMGTSDEGASKAEQTPATGVKSRLRLSGFEPLPAQEMVPGSADVASEGLDLDSPDALEIMGQQRRERILQESNYANGSRRQEGQTMTTMRDIVRTVRQNVVRESDVGSSYTSGDKLRGPESQFMSIKSTYLMSQTTGRRITLTKKKPSFALRVLVQERCAEIIAREIAGFQTNVEIENNTLSVTIDTLKRTADKWLLPRRARKAFRSVAFESLYFVGEHGLVTRGADALFDLSPFEFHGLFSPLLAAMGDAETMEGWMASTNILADVDLQREENAAAGMKDGSRRTRDDNESVQSEVSVSSAAAAAANILAPESIRHPSEKKFRSAIVKSSNVIS